MFACPHSPQAEGGGQIELAERLKNIKEQKTQEEIWHHVMFQLSKMGKFSPEKNAISANPLIQISVPEPALEISVNIQKRIHIVLLPRCKNL